MLDPTQIFQEIDYALEAWDEARASSQYDDLSDLKKGGVLSELVTTLSATIERLAPPSSTFANRAKEITSTFGPSAHHLAHAPLYGVLKSLRQAYERGYLTTVQELVHAEVFADFLDMAEHLLSQGYKDPAAVLIGGTLEEHLRKLCIKHGITIVGNASEPKKTSQINDDLAKRAYDKLQQKGVTYWLDLRNKAAHGKYSEYDNNDVRQMLVGVQNFINKFRA